MGFEHVDAEAALGRAREIVPTLPQPLDAVVARMLAKDPARRLADASAVIAELDALGPFVDMEAGFGGPTQTFTLATELIRVGAAGVHLENQDPSNRTCGHIVNVGKAKRNKVLVPRKEWLAKLMTIKGAAGLALLGVLLLALKFVG